MPEDLPDLVQHAGFIFAGTVQQLGGSTERIPVNRATIVRVNATIEAPPILHNWIGRDITIGLRAPEALKAGDSAIFFAASWVYGEGLALRELSHRALTHDISQVRQQIIESRERLANEDLRQRLRSATLVVFGRVAQVAEAASLEKEGPEREHDPRWLEAILAVEIVLRGKRDTKSVAVLFAGSNHIAWREAPKVRVGQNGLWILHENQIGKAKRNVFVLDDSRDLHNSDELARIQALLHEIG
jgi:hypothetical protein